MKKTLALICTLVASQLIANEKIPHWFIKDMQDNIGTWITDNNSYISDNEKYQSYGMVWEWGIGNSSITGRLYGILDHKNSIDFWQFRQYWDNINKQGMLVQYGHNNTTGLGELKPMDNGSIQVIQTFSRVNGTQWKTKHINHHKNTNLDTVSYDLNKEDQWQKSRHYMWQKITTDEIQPENDLGAFSISLSVKNIVESYAFYQRLGFKKHDGNIKQNWLILKNDLAKIGLFQGLFPNNTITFNPKDIRSIHLKLKQKNTVFVMTNGLEEKSGPASLILTDPDGNPILIDQH